MMRAQASMFRSRPMVTTTSPPHAKFYPKFLWWVALTSFQSVDVARLGNAAHDRPPKDLKTLGQLQQHRPGGAALVWQWIRLFTPIINGYAALFLIGGAIFSAARYAQEIDTRNRAFGNAMIAFGALLPGIGGAMAKADVVEALNAGEFVGILFIWTGYAACVRPGSRSFATAFPKPN